MQHCIDFQVSVYGAQLSSEACRELGFSSNLLCSSCNLLGQFNLNQLDPFCRECCQEEAQLETRKVSFGPNPLWNNLTCHVYDTWEPVLSSQEENWAAVTPSPIYMYRVWICRLAILLWNDVPVPTGQPLVLWQPFPGVTWPVGSYIQLLFKGRSMGLEEGRRRG